MCITLLDVLCGSLTRDGARGGVVKLSKIRNAGISPEDLPESLEAIRQPLAGCAKRSTLDEHTYSTLVNSLYFCRSLVETLLDADPIFSRLKLADLWEVFSTLKDMNLADQVSVLKYWTAWPMAAWQNKPSGRNPPPERPKALPPAQSSCDFPLRGSLRKHFRNLLQSRTSCVRAGTVFTGILQGTKRGCAPVTEEFEVLSCLKHKKALSHAVTLTHELDFVEKFNAIWGQTRKDSRKSYPETSNSDEAHEEDDERRGPKQRWRKVFKNRHLVRQLRNASNHASYEAKRSQGGRKAVIHQFNRLLIGESLKDSSSCPRTPGQVPLLDMYEQSPGKVQERRGYPLAPYEAFLKTAYRLTHDQLAADLTVGRNLKAQVELCLEPLKCRVITKGEAVPYFVAQTFQKAAWKALQDVDAFALTGREVDASFLYGLDKQTRDLDLGFDLWVSGDYSAATDGLSLEVNQACMRSMMDAFNATPEEREICLQVLGCHEVSYPNRLRKEGDGLDPFVMENGQLMGSVLSFPVLCAINLAAYWCALEEYTGRRFKKEQLPVLVNGDDILFKANEAFYQVWQKWIKRAGFTLSVGKNYISPHLITVNSKTWLHKGGSNFVQLPFLNCGLLLQEADGPVRPPLRWETAEKPLIPKLQTILDTANDPVRAFNRIKHYWKRSIKIHTQDGLYNLCAPVELGGCGLHLPQVCRSDVHFTAFQQLIAGRSHQIYKNFAGEVIREHPSTGLERIALAKPTTPLNPVATVDRPGLAVIRARTEPVRGDKEVRFGDNQASRRVATDLNTAQDPVDADRPEYKLRIVPRRRIANAFAAETKISKPFDFDLEIRKQLTWGPTDDASPPVKDMRDLFDEPTRPQYRGEVDQKLVADMWAEPNKHSFDWKILQKWLRNTFHSEPSGSEIDASDSHWGRVGFR